MISERDHFKPLNWRTEAAARDRARKLQALRDARSAKRDVTSRVGFGHCCGRPYMRESAESGVLTQHRCYKCDACRAFVKNQWAGAAFAEADASSFVAMVTLTAGGIYRGFWNMREIKNYKQWVRDDAKRRGLTSPRFLCVPEIGKSERHKHWHLLWFFSEDPGWVDTPQSKDGRAMQAVDGWPCGYGNFRVVKRAGDVLCGGLDRIRYVCKYINKGERKPGMPRPSKSIGRHIGDDGEVFCTPLGWKAAHWHGLEYARAGLPLPARMKIPGFHGSKRIFAPDGSEKKVDQTYELNGALARVACRAYAAEWARTRPHIDVDQRKYDSPLRRLHDPDYAEPTDGKAFHAHAWFGGRALDPLRPKPVVEDRDRSGALPVLGVNGQPVAFVHMKRDGFVTCQPLSESVVVAGAHWFKSGDLAVSAGSLRGVVDLPEAVHCAVERWIAERRGPDWADLQAWRGEFLQRRRLQVRAVKRVFDPRTMIGRKAHACPSDAAGLARDGPARAWVGRRA